MKKKKISNFKTIFEVTTLILGIYLLIIGVKNLLSCEPNYKIIGVIVNYEIKQNNISVESPLLGKRFFDCKTECYNKYKTNSYKILNGTLIDNAINTTYFCEKCYCDLNNCYLKSLLK